MDEILEAHNQTAAMHISNIEARGKTRPSLVMECLRSFEMRFDSNNTKNHF